MTGSIVGSASVLQTCRPACRWTDFGRWSCYLIKYECWVRIYCRCFYCCGYKSINVLHEIWIMSKLKQAWDCNAEFIQTLMHRYHEHNIMIHMQYVWHMYHSMAPRWYDSEKLMCNLVKYICYLQNRFSGEFGVVKPLGFICRNRFCW